MATPAPSLPTTSSSSLRAVGQLTPAPAPTPTTTTTTTTNSSNTRANTPTPTPSSSTPHLPPPSSSTTTTSAQTPQFSFPPYYDFPPFFTRQPNLTTQANQHAKWSSLLQSYCAYRRQYKLSASDPVFLNKRLGRRLAAADAREVFEYMRRDGRAEFVRAGSSSATINNIGGIGSSISIGIGGRGGGGGGEEGEGGGGEGDLVWIYWRTPEEWASYVEAWVDDTAQKNTVLTLYELSQGEETVGTEFHGLDPELLQKALQVLVKRNKAQIFGQEDQLGVKFF